MSSNLYNKKMYEEDTRPACNYGIKCYQKNEAHRNKYKHPPPTNQKKEDNSESKTKKRSWKDRKEDVESSSKSSESDSASDSDSELPVIKKPCVSPKPSDKTEESNVAVEDKGSTKKEEEKDDPVTATNSANELADHQVDDDKKIFKEKFLVNMPDDFYKFYELCKEILPKDPTNAFKIANLKLVGPYDILNGKLNDANIEDDEDYLRHWRYFYDPPEFQTIIKGNDKDGLHLGYWRDDPKEDPVFVAKNYAKIECKIKPVAETVFGAVDVHLEEGLKMVSPFEKPKFASLRQKLRKFANSMDIRLDKSTENMRSREKKVVAKTFHGAGIVVPYNKKTQLGYRELAVTDASLKKILKHLDELEDENDINRELSHLEEVERLATIAADECDFGTCLEFGHDLFSSGCKHVQNTAIRMLSTAYTLLNRQEFIKILQAHSKNRKKDTPLSIISSEK